MHIKTIILILFSYILSQSYYEDIQPIFNANCTSCHIYGHDSGLDLSNYTSLMSGSNNGEVIIVGDHLSSLLWQKINDGSMPSYPNPPLNSLEINLIAQWIDSGALEYLPNCNEGYSYYEDIDSIYTNVTIQDEGTCFNNGDLAALNDIISENNFTDIENTFLLGTQTWNEGRLRFLVAGYYFSGVEEQITTIPESIGNLTDLRKLYLEWNAIESLPDTFSNMSALVQLYISNNNLSVLPENFGDLQNLYILDLGYNNITELPNSIIEINNLGYLWIFNNQLQTLPNDFCSLDLDWDNDDYFGYPYFASGGNMLCEDVPECIANSSHFNTSLEQYYYSVQITMEQDCSFLGLFETNNIIFQLNKIYPNPFNPITNIGFSLIKSEEISISIYDLKGYLIQTLINNELMNSGNHNIIWNASLVPSGIYFINISNGVENKTQKIILQK